jgi:hypothetical protein
LFFIRTYPFHSFTIFSCRAVNCVFVIISGPREQAERIRDSVQQSQGRTRGLLMIHLKVVEA